MISQTPRPSSPGLDTGYGTSINAVFGGDSRPITRVVKYFNSLIFCEFGKPNTLSVRGFAILERIRFVCLFRIPPKIAEVVIVAPIVFMARVMRQAWTWAYKGFKHHNVNGLHFGFMPHRQIHGWISIQQPIRATDLFCNTPKTPAFRWNHASDGFHSAVITNFIKPFKSNDREPFFHLKILKGAADGK